MTEARLILGDCLEVMAGMEPDSIDAIVTDPPYGLGFMGKKWDSLPPGPEVAEQMYRVLKPSHYLLAFGGTRTWHRLAVALEDAGFKIRDTLMWLYGSGFPKGKGNLKPAYEPIILCRKPGGKVRPLGIDECRIEGVPEATRFDPAKHSHDGWRMDATGAETAANAHPSGRWPANLILDEEAGALLDAQSGVSKSGVAVRSRSGGKTFGTDTLKPPMDDMTYGDSGGASRFFYCAKASRSERNAGCEGLETRTKRILNGGIPSAVNSDPRGMSGGGDREATNHHPTVKPVALMSWLIKLIAPPGATVLDPFMGSGSTGVACANTGREFIGIEREAEYVEIAKARIDAATRQGVLL